MSVYGDMIHEAGQEPTCRRCYGQLTEGNAVEDADICLGCAAVEERRWQSQVETPSTAYVGYPDFEAMPF